MNVFAQFIILAATKTGTDGAEEASGLGLLGIDPLAILFQAGTFIVLFILIRKFAMKKIVEVLDERHDTIQEGLDNAQQIKQQLADSTEAQAAAIKKARQEADTVIARAHEEAGAMLKETELAATKKSEKIVADSQAKVAADISKAKKDLRGEMLALVAQATETVIGEKMTAKTDEALIKKALAGDK